MAAARVWVTLHAGMVIVADGNFEVDGAHARSSRRPPRMGGLPMPWINDIAKDVGEIGAANILGRLKRVRKQHTTFGISELVRLTFGEGPSRSPIKKFFKTQHRALPTKTGHAGRRKRLP